MGMRMRLKASFDISGYPPEDQVILTALKQYGAIMADNGTSMYIGGTTDSRWNNDHLGDLRQSHRLRFRGVADLAAVHAPERSYGPQSDDQQLYRDVLGRTGTAGNAQLDCDKRGVLHCVTFAGSSSW